MLCTCLCVYVHNVDQVKRLCTQHLAQLSPQACLHCRVRRVTWARSVTGRNWEKVALSSLQACFSCLRWVLRCSEFCTVLTRLLLGSKIASSKIHVLLSHAAVSCADTASFIVLWCSQTSAGKYLIWSIFVFSPMYIGTTWHVVVISISKEQWKVHPKSGLNLIQKNHSTKGG